MVLDLGLGVGGKRHKGRGTRRGSKSRKQKGGMAEFMGGKRRKGRGTRKKSRKGKRH